MTLRSDYDPLGGQTYLTEPVSRLKPGEQFTLLFEMRIDITDNGYGVAASQRDAMFEMFATTRPSGTGLGLFVAKEIILQLGGEIRMKTDCIRYRNNTFSIFLPKSEPTTS